MVHQVKAQPTKIAGKLSHHGLIQLLIQELLKRRNMAWAYFLFWNGFETSLQPEEKGKSPTKNSSTPRSGRRKRRDISLATAEQSPFSSKAKKFKRNLDFSEKGQEVTTHSENILNLPYSDLEEEKDKGTDLALQVVAEIEELLSPTPKEQDEPAEKASYSKLGTQRINQLLRQVYEMEIL